jgi:hypothetical protein
MKVLPEGAYPYLRMGDRELLKSCSIHPYQASGPGGQKRNRRLSAVRIIHNPTGLSSIAEESRSQGENKARALRRLRKVIALSLRKAEMLPGAEARAAVKEMVRPGQPLRINPRNPDYPLFCAIILDALFLNEGGVRDACAVVGTSSGQLTRCIGRDKDLLQAANKIRESFGLGALRRSTK